MSRVPGLHYHQVKRRRSRYGDASLGDTDDVVVGRSPSVSPQRVEPPRASLDVDEINTPRRMSLDEKMKRAVSVSRDLTAARARLREKDDHATTGHATPPRHGTRRSQSTPAPRGVPAPQQHVERDVGETKARDSSPPREQEKVSSEFQSFLETTKSHSPPVTRGDAGLISSPLKSFLESAIAILSPNPYTANDRDSNIDSLSSAAIDPEEEHDSKENAKDRHLEADELDYELQLVPSNRPPELGALEIAMEVSCPVCPAEPDGDALTPCPRSEHISSQPAPPPCCSQPPPPPCCPQPPPPCCPQPPPCCPPTPPPSFCPQPPSCYPPTQIPPCCPQPPPCCPQPPPCCPQPPPCCPQPPPCCPPTQPPACCPLVPTNPQYGVYVLYPPAPTLPQCVPQVPCCPPGRCYPPPPLQKAPICLPKIPPPCCVLPCQPPPPPACCPEPCPPPCCVQPCPPPPPPPCCPDPCPPPPPCCIEPPKPCPCPEPPRMWYCPPEPVAGGSSVDAATAKPLNLATRTPSPLGKPASTSDKKPLLSKLMDDEDDDTETSSNLLITTYMSRNGNF